MKMCIYKHIVLIILTLLAVTAKGQDFPCQHFTTKDGLPSNTVYAVYRDSKGLLWFATDKGIASYNGLHFESYTTTNGLADNEVFFFLEDYLHRLWIGTYNGELCYYKDGIFHTAKNTPFLNIPMKTSFTRYMSIESDSSITISYYNGEKFLNIKGNKARVYTVPLLGRNSLRDEVVRRKKLADAKFSIESSELKIILDSNSNLADQHSMSRDEMIYCTFCQGQEYVHTRTAIYTFDNQKISDLPQHLPLMTKIHKVYVNKKNLLACTDNGLYINDNIHTFKDQRVSCVTQDVPGNYWISTLKNGVYTFPENLNNRMFTHLYKGEVLNGMQYSKGHYYITDKSDLYHFHNDSNINILDYNKYQHVAENTVYQNIAFNIDSNDLFLYNYNTILALRNINKKNQSILKRSIILGSFGSLEGRTVYADGDNIYLQRPAGIVLLSRKNILNDQKTTNSNFTKWGTQDRIFTMAKMPGLGILYSTLDKVYKIVDQKKYALDQFKSISFKKFYCFNNYVVGYTHNNNLIVCSNIDSNIVIDSIVDQNCVWDKLYQLDSKHILVSTNNLYRVLTLPGSGNKSTINLTENPFLPIDAEHIFVDSGNCYFLKNGDITKISINEVLAGTPTPGLFFKNLKTANNKYKIDSVLSLSYGEAKNLTIQVGVVNYAGKNIIFQYSFSKNGTDNWRNMTSEDINIINSGYGTYIVKVRAKTLSSDMSQPIQFKLVIARPYWATWWFLLLSGALIVSITILIVRYRLDMTFKKNRINHQREIRYIKSEYKALNALMNPHFIFNTLNNVQSLVNKDEKRAANEYLRIFANLIRQNMHNTSLELINLSEEMDLVNNYLKLEKLRYKDLLNYEITIDENTDINDIMIPPLLIQPLVENSIKHGLFPRKSIDNLIRIHIYEQDNILTIVVKDNGIGLEEAKLKKDPEHKSFGLENIRKRLHHASVIQNREITLQLTEQTDEYGLQWTVVTIRIELAKK